VVVKEAAEEDVSVERKFKCNWIRVNNEEFHDLHSPPTTSIRETRSIKKYGRDILQTNC
jgi:hypothetical protein